MLLDVVWERIPIKVTKLNKDNVVHFPLQHGHQVLGADPIDELMNEFSHIREDDLRTLGLWDDEEVQREAIEEMNLEGPIDKLENALRKLDEIEKRLSHYLGEIENNVRRK